MDGQLPPTTLDQRSRFYEDTVSLITSGFLTHSVRVGGVNFALRSLSPGDLYLLKARIGKGGEQDWHIWTIASSVWVVDGFSLLGEANATPYIAEAVRRLPPVGREILFAQVMGLFARQNRAIDAVEAYSYEAESRFKWKALSGVGLAKASGIPGAEHLGMNYLQQMWVFFNELEDQRLRDETMWEGFKLSVSPHSPKGIKKIDAQDQQRKRDEMSRRQAVMDRCYYERVGVMKPRKKGERDTVDSHGLTLKSVDDLEAEMHRWVTGQEDSHDQIVRAYKAQITAKHDQEKREREARAEALRQEYARLEQDIGPSRMVAYTPEQLGEVLKGRPGGVSGTRTIQDGPPVQEYLYSRYLERAPDAGVLKAVEGRLVAEVTAPVPNAELMGLITQRDVPFSTEEIEE